MDKEKEKEIHNLNSKELLARHKASAKELNDIINASADEKNNPDAHINWEKAGEKLDRAPSEVQERARDLVEECDAVVLEGNKRREKTDMERAARSSMSAVEEAFEASDRGLIDEAADADADTVFDALVKHQDADFQKRYAERKSYNTGQVIREDFTQTGIRDYFNATNTTANTIAVHRPRDDSRLLFYRDPRVPLFQRLRTIRPLAGGDSYSYVKEYGAGGYKTTTGKSNTSEQKSNEVAPKAEATTFAEQEYQAGVVVITAKKLTAYSKISDEQLADVRAARRFVNTRLTRNFEQEIEDQIINGNGTSPNWTGILAQTNKQTVTKTGAIKKLDIFIDAINAFETTTLSYPNALLLRPANKNTFSKLKDGDGNYIWSNPVTGMPNTIFGVPVVMSHQQPANQGLMINTNDFALLDKQGVMVEWGYAGTDFIDGIQSVRGTMRGNVIAWYENSAVVVDGLEIADS